MIDWTLTAELSSARFCSTSCTTDFAGAGIPFATQVPCFFIEDFLPGLEDCLPGLASGELVPPELFRLNDDMKPLEEPFLLENMVAAFLGENQTSGGQTANMPHHLMSINI